MNYTKCWLDYSKNLPNDNVATTFKCDFSGDIAESAVNELKRAWKELYKTELTQSDNAQIELLKDENIHAEGYNVQVKNGKATVKSGSVNGMLYGVFALLRLIQMNNKPWNELDITENSAPKNPLRMLNHWDNMTGDIERGYSGNSFFFENNEVIVNERTTDYARLVASVGLNAVVINNVNVKDAATYLITDRYFDKLRQMQKIFASYGIKLYLSVNFAAPMEIGTLNTADPCDESVKAWWKDRAKEVYENLPELGGFLVKADSEGRPGPFTYNRTHADGANMLAEAIEPYGGIVVWRCFVYNCQQDWRDTKTDRARAGYENFMPIDGDFKDNVILQIKNGPMDFQVREPISPLFGGLKQTNMMLEVQIAQEYTGQQRHVCYLIPWFKEILAQNMYCAAENSTVADIVSGRTYKNVNCGMAAVANTGNDENWTGHDMAAANFYGFGRLAFDTDLSSEQIAKEWICLTFGYNKIVTDTLFDILMKSWSTYEKYNAPLGIGWMVNPNYHYGPNVDGYEYDRWGTYHRADHEGIGVDRTSAGTGYTEQYNEPLASTYANVETCPDELILFFHHLPYTYKLNSGKTIIQHIYDTHFEGAEDAANFLTAIENIKPYLADDVYERMHKRFEHQKAHAKEWCDVINSYFYRKTGIKDNKGRTIY